MGKYIKINKNDVANGEGVCVSYWVSGCEHHCPGCHNPETWNRNNGKDFTEDTVEEIISAISANGIMRNLAFTGGDPLAPYNLNQINTISNTVRGAYPDIKIYMWTGYVLENLTTEQLDAIKNIDVLIDGRFEEDLKDLTLELRGSSNQRILTKEDIYGEVEKRKGKLKTTATTGFARIKK